MTFAAPALLAGLLLVPLGIVGYLVIQRRRGRYAVRFTNVDLLANLVPKVPAWRRHVPPALYLVAIGALVLALARPSMTIAVPREEATVVLAIDVSRSMRATDVEPTRLAAAQQAASDFVDRLPAGFKVGLVVFSTEARTLVTPTTDRAQLHDALDSLRADGGTALGDAIALSLEAAGLDSAAGTGATGEDPIVATVLLSDGANSTGELEPIEAADRAAALGVPVYTIALGTTEGIVDVPNQAGFLEPMPVPPDPETLATVAEITDGRFFEAPTSADLAAIYENLGSRVGYENEVQEVTQLFAAAGLAFIVAGAALAAHWFNRFP